MSRRERAGPPAAAERVLARMVPFPDADAVAGDLREEYAERIGRGASRWTTDIWYWLQVIAIGTRYRTARSLEGAGLGGDLRLAARQLRRRPGYSATIVAAIALGIGVNTVIMAVADAVFLEPLPYPDAERLGIVSNDHSGSSTDDFGVSHLNMDDARARARGIAAWALYLDWQDVNLTGIDEAHRLPANFVTPDYLTMLGHRAIIGRLLDSDDDRTGAPASVAVLAEESWERLFGRDPGVLGRAVQLNGYPFEIVGVVEGGRGELRERYQGTGTVEIYLPLEAAPRVLGLALRDGRGDRFMNALVRLEPGTSFAAAQSELRSISAELQRAFPESNEGWSYRLTSLSEAFFADVRTPVVVLLVGAALVLALVCVNLANVVLIRSTARAAEWAMRRALGAGGARLARQLATEAALLTVLGGALGLLIGAWGLDALAMVGGVRLPGFTDIGLDGRVAAVALALAAGAGLFIGAVAVLGAGRGARELRASTARGGTRGAERARAGLILTEVGLAFVLLVGAGLMLESFRTLKGTGYGFDTDRLLLARTDLRGEAYASEEARRLAATELLNAARAIPGAGEAFLWSPNRLGHGNWVALLTREGRYELFPQERLEASRHSVHPGALEAVGIELLAGRTFQASDDEGGAPVVVVSESLARALWPGEGAEAAVGQRLEGQRAGGLVGAEVVGVVADARHRTRLIDPFGPQLDIYFPYAQLPTPYMTVALRAAEGADPTVLAPAARAVVRDFDADLPVYEVATMESLMREEEGRARLAALLVGLYAALAVLLAGLGVYGVLANAVRLETREIGIRRAIGARTGTEIGRVVGRGMRLTLLGAAAGLVAALAVARLLDQALYGVDPWTPWVFGVVGVLLPTVGLVACVQPAVRAVRIDPVEALRSE